MFMKRVPSRDGSSPIQEAFLCNTNALMHMDECKQICEHEFPILTASPKLTASVFAPPQMSHPMGTSVRLMSVQQNTQLAGSDL